MASFNGLDYEIPGYHEDAATNTKSTATANLANAILPHQNRPTP
jgi:hypothetical protein